MNNPPIGATVLGYPRIGPNRELKRAVERYWSGALDESGLRSVAADLRARTWHELTDSGLDSLPGNTFSYYDQVLDTAALFGVVPRRYRDLGLGELDTYFAMARGTAEVAPLELTKWFDTNYHYLVPEIALDTTFALSGDKPVAEYLEALALGVTTRPVLVGPVTFLLLAKAAPDAPEGFAPLDLLDSLLDRYAELLAILAGAGVGWVQLDEPAFVADRTGAELAALRRAYDRLSALSDRPRLLVAGYFGDLGDALPVLADTAVEAIAVDLVAGPQAAERIPTITGLRRKTLVAGVIEGRNVWRADLRAAATLCATLLGSAETLAVSTSCSLLHVPYDLDAEPDLDPALRSRFAFARQKVDEVVTLGKVLSGDGVVVAEALARSGEEVRRGVAAARRDDVVRARVAALEPTDRSRAPYAERAAAQAERLGLPPLATTTIGSFPQTSDVRRARADRRKGIIDEAGYDERMRAEVERVIRLQEEIGLDVLVHGEPERNDMVQYFAEQLDGFAHTEFGWVQSYGSRCVRPPILHGDVSRPAPMTVRWSAYAQSLTAKPVKGMLTGPVTILAWSFVRDDQPLADTADQVALALRDEIADLAAAGLAVVQVDEPALRETLPLRAEDRKCYLDWAVGAFRLATAGAAPSTQIHTHLCYSEFGEVIGAIDGLDADVTTIEAARSHMEILDDLAAIGFARGVGPGVYDIHSPRVPDTAELTALLREAVRAVPAERLWGNPDCGLKTRRYAEVNPALRNLVTAARTVRGE
ncbi:5-methyltetrahydropteroyltriglutamate--homocysteine S-methyltransferase [Actinokineospora sp. NBRC 105648]|uniref:5-methyltetrahydropteroyltriglutamate-- homocysteine S-methyltransferase n=1 Tax=Actinokineospora sp. NBRC 105648 TaxID=3032206 RepID=UPI0024A3C545|nr:5-methyltetrahydropteroyltriglutamate--homocysteine S-methyltransferase [Actinokineospora sp. NBRC 105648]GLZ40748.1 5-methyltetrahydropteroyltriglutamate--homocysteine methyltransferase [Actinokineospora sp. NBRC 105648]